MNVRSKKRMGILVFGRGLAGMNGRLMSAAKLGLQERSLSTSAWGIEISRQGLRFIGSNLPNVPTKPIALGEVGDTRMGINCAEELLELLNQLAEIFHGMSRDGLFGCSRCSTILRSVTSGCAFGCLLFIMVIGLHLRRP